MKAAVLLLCVAVAILIAAMNAGAVLDASIRLYGYPPARAVIAVIWTVIGLALGAMALALISRRARRQVETDFPEQHGGIGAADFETVQRHNERN